MPFTVTCPACASRFTLGDDLYERRVAGNLVTVKCRQCSAEIAVDATEPATTPSHEAPRRAPSPPRPKLASVTRMGLGPAPPAAALVGQNATASPKPAAAQPALSWDDNDETVQINAPKLPPAPGPKLTTLLHLPRAPHPPRKIREEEKEEEEPELIEAEEIPASSSDAPTLDALTLEAGPTTLPGKRAPDELLVNLSAGMQATLGAPTIDVSNLEAPPLSADRMDTDVDVVEEDEVQPAPMNRGGRGGTMPLFDMSAVLPAASEDVKPTTVNAASPPAPASDSDSPASVSVRAPESKARERKFVVAPRTSTAATTSGTTPKTKRGGAALWFGLVAAAAGIVAVVGLRGHRPQAPVTSEPAAQPQTPRALEAENAATESAPHDSAASAPTSEPAARSAATVTPAASPTRVVSAVSVTTGSSNAKSGAAFEKPAVPAEPVATSEKPALEKTADEKTADANPPVEAHNAPPPAAEGTEFDRAAARNALASAAAQAASCRKEGDPSGTATITITFAPSGRITSANLQGPPFAGTATGGCIANAMRHATVPAFSGEHVTVTKQIVIE